MPTETAVVAWEEYNERGRRLVADGDPAGAEAAFTAAIAAAEQPGADPLQLASSLSNLAQLKYQQKAHLVAEDLFRRALAIREQTLGADDKSVITSINNLAALYVSRGALDEAEPLLKRATAASAKRVESSQSDLAVNLNNLARLYFKRGDYAKAEPLLLQLLTLKRPMGPEHPEVATVLGSLAKVRQALGKVDAAERVWRRVLAVRERTLPPSDPAIIQAQEGLADALVAQGKLAPAYDLRERVLAARTAALGADHAVVAGLRRKLDDLRMSMAAQTASTTIPIPPRRPSTGAMTIGAATTIESARVAEPTMPTRRSRVSGIVEAMDRAPIEMLGDDDATTGEIATAIAAAIAPVPPAARRAPAETPVPTPTPTPIEELPAVEWIEPTSTAPAAASRPSAAIARPSAAVARPSAAVARPSAAVPRTSAAVARKSAALPATVDATSAERAAMSTTDGDATRTEPASEGRTGRTRRPMQFGTLEKLGRSRGKFALIGIALLVICLLVVGVVVGPSLISGPVPPPPGVHSIRRVSLRPRVDGGAASSATTPASSARAEGDSAHDAGSALPTAAATTVTPAASPSPSGAPSAAASVAAAFAATGPTSSGPSGASPTASHAVASSHGLAHAVSIPAPAPSVAATRPVQAPLPNRPLPPANTFAAHMGPTPAASTPPAADDSLPLPPAPVVNVDNVGKTP